MQNLTRSLALETPPGASGSTGSAGVTVTPINRSWIDDPVGAPHGGRATSRCGGRATRRRWLRRRRSCTRQAAYTTGQTLFIDGGLTLHPSSDHHGRPSRPHAAGPGGARGAARPAISGQAGRYRAAVPQEQEPVLLAQRSATAIAGPGPAGPGQPGHPLGIASGQHRGHESGTASSSRPAAASCPFRVGPPSASTRAYPRSASAPSATARFTSRSPAMITSARSAAFLRSSAGASATVITIGGVTAAVKKGESQSSRQEHRHGNGQRPVMLRANGSGRDEHDIGLGAEHREQRLVGRAAQAAGHAADRSGAVDAGDHVEPHGGPPARPDGSFAVQSGRVHGVAEEMAGAAASVAPPAAGGPRARAVMTHGLSRRRPRRYAVGRRRCWHTGSGSFPPPVL